MTAIDWDQSLTPTLAEAQRDEWESNRTHPDVVCPPDPDAICQHCGLELHAHQTNDGPGMIPTPDNAVCIDDAALLQKRVVWNDFELAVAQSFACPHATCCETCGVALCSEHSTAFTACVDNRFTLHHLDCVKECEDCMRQVAEDSAEDHAIESWKGVA